MYRLLLLSIPLLLLVLLLTGCRGVETVPLDRVRTDTLRLFSERRDSVVMRDSVFVRSVVRGDTVREERLVVRYRDRFRLVRDTVYRVRRDSVEVAVPVSMPRRASLADRIKDALFLPLLAVAALWVLTLIRLVRRRNA